ncbi:MAG: hypothetical protein HY433_03900 [Candidatus Liptonbacteria bacterium]|nr:hypothetical protein [Candidatus Liptonbacteria bacterium]
MNRTSVKEQFNPLLLEEAREAVMKLKTLKPFLSSQDEETLSVLMDQELVSRLKRSLNEASAGKLEPLKNILA